MSQQSSVDENIGLYTLAPRQMTLNTTTIPTPGPGEVLLRMNSVGICGSDMHLYKAGNIGGQMQITAPHALGHEGAGTVVALGPGVTDLQVGDRCAVEPGIPCWCVSCDACRSGQYNNCPELNGRFCSLPPSQGLLRQFHVHPAQWLHKLPDGISNEVGALLEPLSVALHAVRRGGVQAGDPVLVTGAGPIGILTALCARVAGAAPIWITDIGKPQLDLAAKVVSGVQGFLVNPNDTIEATVDVMTAAGIHPSVTFVCSGSPISNLAGVYLLSPGGVHVILGFGPDFTLPVSLILAKEVDIRGVNKYRNTWPAAIRMLSSGVIDPEKLKLVITKRVPLEEGAKAFETFDYGKTIIEL